MDMKKTIRSQAKKATPKPQKVPAAVKRGNAQAQRALKKRK